MLDNLIGVPPIHVVYAENVSPEILKKRALLEKLGITMAWKISLNPTEH